MMPCTRLCVELAAALMVQARVKESSRPYKLLMREHEGSQFIIYHYNTKV